MTSHLALMAEASRTEIHKLLAATTSSREFNSGCVHLKNALSFYGITDVLRLVSTNANVSLMKTNDVQDQEVKCYIAA